MSEQVAEQIIEHVKPSSNGHKPAVSAATPAAPARRPRSKAVVVVGFLLLIGAGAGLWHYFSQPAVAAGVLPVSGRIEGDDAAVAAKTAGRIREITVREGDRVEAGQLIATLDDQQIRAREQQAEASVRHAEARARVSQHQIAVLNEQLQQSRLGVDQARADTLGRVHEAEASVAAAEADLVQAEATYAQAKWDRDALTKLYERELIAEQQARQAQNTERSQAAIVAAAQRRLDAARGTLAIAKATLVTPAIRTSQVAAAQGQIIQAEADLAAARADAERARGQLDEARANRADLEVRAPFAGTVVTRTAEPGEVVVAGTPIITLLNLAEVYLRAFVPEGEIGRVRVGQIARVYLDSSPSKPIDAVLIRVDPRASFTPENTYFREDRVKQVIGVKLQLRGGVGFAKPGMPADGEILTDGSSWPIAQAR